VLLPFDSLAPIREGRFDHLERLRAALAEGTLIHLRYRHDRPRAAVSLTRVQAPLAQTARVAGDVFGFPKLIQMMDSVKRVGQSPHGPELVRVNLRFRIAFFRVGFYFVATHEREAHITRLRYQSGKLRDVNIDVETAPLGDNETLLRVMTAFDPRSLGWLTNTFLKHHPEIEGGVHGGAVMSIADGARRALERPSVRAG